MSTCGSKELTSSCMCLRRSSWRANGMARPSADGRSEISCSQRCEISHIRTLHRYNPCSCAALRKDPSVALLRYLATNRLSSIFLQNESERVESAIRSVIKDQAVSLDRIIVVDGGSRDATVAKARRLGVKVLVCSKGRARQMNNGAQNAQGDWLLFLHADSQIPEGYVSMVEECLWRHQHKCRKPALWGCFESIQLDIDDWGSRILRTAVRLRTRLLHLPYGDQGFFVQTSLFWEVGGFMEAPLMEDVDLVQKLYKKAGPPAVVPQAILTSGRRWQQLGYVRTTLLNWSLLCLYKLGTDPARLALWYYGAGKLR